MFWEKLFCVLAVAVLGLIILWMSKARYRFLRKCTDSESKIKFTARRENRVSDHNRRFTRRQDSLFISDCSVDANSYFDQFYKEKVKRVEKNV